MLELLAGLFVALAALALVLEPLARPSTPATHSGTGDETADPLESESPKVRALVALREIEFDRATGKLSDEDYVRLKAKYEAAAIAAIEAEERGAGAATAAASIPAVSAVAPVSRGSAVCPACGPRPEAAPIFCSRCGRSLVGGAQLAGV